MASDVVYTAIKNYLIGAWSNCPIAWENEDFVRPEPPGPWILFEITGTMYAQQSIGDSPQSANRWDEEGVMWLHVFVPKGTGSVLARNYAKGLADLFRGAWLINSLEFLAAAIGEGAPADDMAVYWRVSVSIEWRHWDAAIGVTTFDDLLSEDDGNPITVEPGP